MADYPDNIFSPRAVENLPGVSYDPDLPKEVYAEDYALPAAEIVAIQETLGTNPQGIYTTVKEWLEALSAGGAAAWGSITGTLSDQTDLQSALDAKQNALGFTAEDVANKATAMAGNTASNTKYLSAKAVYDWGIATFQTALGFTAENIANKSTSVTTDQASNTKYPSVKAVYDWATGAFQTALGFTAEDVANKKTTMSGNTASNTFYLSAKAINDWGVATFAAIAAVLPTGGSSGQFLKKNSGTNYDASWSGVTKSDVGLGNVDNTSDATKNSATATLTSKRITKRTDTVSSSATPTINTDTTDFFSVTALAVAITSFTTNLSGTPTDGQTLWIAITGTASRAIAWGAKFEASTIPLPTTTAGTARLDVGFVWNTATTTWRCVAVA